MVSFLTVSAREIDRESDGDDNKETQETPATMVLDPAGDVRLQISNASIDSERSFLVSSKVLSLASPVLRSLLGPHFKEGSQMRSSTGTCPTISLKEDDPEMMDIMLSVIHFKCENVPPILTPERLASLAIHCDKYSCAVSMRPWAMVWFANIPKSPQDNEKCGFLMLASYILLPEKFPDFSAVAARNLTWEFQSTWERHEIISLLPTSIIGMTYIRKQQENKKTE